MMEEEANDKDAQVRRSWVSKINPLRWPKATPVPQERTQSPEYKANILSVLTFQWMTSIMSTGYQRPLELNDIWLVNPDRSTPVIAAKLKAALHKHHQSGKKRPLLRALFETFKKELILGGLGALLSNSMSVFMPFVLKYLIIFASKAYYAERFQRPAPHIGEGIGLVLGITFMQIFSSLGSNQFMYRGMMMGGMARSALISVLFEKAMTISGRAKAGGKGLTMQLPPGIEPGSAAEKDFYAQQLEENSEKKSKKSKKKEDKSKGDSDEQGWSNGRIVNLMSVDTYRIDQVSGWLHMVWVAPLILVITIILLLVNLTYSALVGIAVFFIAAPLLGIGVKSLMKWRRKVNKLTDQRVSIVQEVFQAIRFVKFYNWEKNFLDRLQTVRKREIRAIQIMLSFRNGIFSIGMSIPIFASMLAFVTYNQTKHPLNPAPIFSSLALFNMLRMPMTLLPMVLGLVTDALASLERIEKFLLAEDSNDTIQFRDSGPNALEIREAAFTWEQSAPPQPEKAHSKKGERSGKHGKRPKDKSDKKSLERNGNHDNKEIKAVTIKEEAGEIKRSGSTSGMVIREVHDKHPFQIKDLHLSIGRGEFIAIVGGVGSGKSSLLSAIAGDMRQTEGSVTITGTRAFCPQSAWIQNTTVQENITFGKPYDKQRFNEVIEACGLRPDLEILPHGSNTEIGERGINLSGGQKQRVNLARAIYFDADIVLLDDPLSAVDAHVGRHILEHALCGLLKHKCRLLATHQLHVLYRCDRIILMSEGKIVAFDTFASLMSSNTTFQRMMTTVDQEKKEDRDEEDEQLTTELKKVKSIKESGDSLMQEEERATKSMTSVWLAYFRATGSIVLIPLGILVIAISQAVNIMTNLWLAWWTSRKYDLSTGTYIGVYCSLGVAQSIFMYIGGISITIFGTNAGRTMAHKAMKRAMRAPTSFFDTTPLGRIINRFSRDVDVMDNNLTESMRIALLTVMMVVAVLALTISYYYYFAAALVPLCCIYVYSAAYYRASAREIKRHEAVLRSSVFARFGEALSGTSTVRAYGLQGEFQRKLDAAIDNMDSAYYLTFSNQRWLGIRLDAIGVSFLFVCGILIVTNRFSIDPSIGGLVLSYLMSILMIMQTLVRQVADVENNMNTTERMHYYGTQLEQEAPAHTPNTNVPDSWPSQGDIIFQDVKMRYRERLPLVLQGINLHIRPGERLGIVGRTGAGKSSIANTLFRITELTSGSIAIDGLDISTVGLDDLRSRIAIIPQDPTLFQGTVRSNLDPFNKHTDLELWSALRHAHLVDGASAESSENKIDLETSVESEGVNLSLGQRQLMALARALVRGSRIIICDEATSSIDFETDRKIQRTMAEGFRGKTLLCIAHRLRTIIEYDRVCVLDQGKVVELDTPLGLYDEDGIFRGMCERSGISREDILRAGEEYLGKVE